MPCRRANILKTFRSCQRPFVSRSIYVLALESSADDTCAAVVSSDRKILSNVVAHQFQDQEKWGGIHPMIATECHQKRMPGVVRMALEKSGMDMNSIDGIAFTRGPGMVSCLNVGANAAKTLAAALNKPIVGVHHMQAHALTPFLTSENPPQFPFLALLASGGYTMLLLATSPVSFQMLANTADVSIGNAFDKVSRELKIPWGETSGSGRIGAGPMLEKVAAKHPASAPYSFPEFPLAMHGTLGFSFGGLVSSVQRLITKLGPDATEDSATQAAIAHAFQHAAVGQLQEKLMLALRTCERKGIVIKTVVVSGGVASNMYLRSCVESTMRTLGVAVQYPPISLCTDNAAMIAWASMDRFLRGDVDPYDITVKPKWDLGELHTPSE